MPHLHVCDSELMNEFSHPIFSKKVFWSQFNKPAHKALANGCCFQVMIGSAVDRPVPATLMAPESCAGPPAGAKTLTQQLSQRT